MDGFFADYDCTLLLLVVSSTNAALAADAGIAKRFNELTATFSLVGLLWMEFSPTMVVRSSWCATPVLSWR